MRYPLTASQLAIYYESVNNAGLPVYIIPVMLTLDASVDLNRLSAAVQKAVAAYPVLSMVLGKDDVGMPYLTACDSEVRCEIEEMSETEFDRLLGTLPELFDLEGGKLFETRILKTPKSAYLYLAFHHIIGDGSTCMIVINAIRAAYEGKELPDEPMNIFDVQAKEAENRNSPGFEEARNWYIETFGDIETDSLPLPDILEVKDADDKDTIRVAQLVRRLDVDYGMLYNLSRRIGVPLSIVLDGAFGYMLGIWNAAEESSFCTIFAGRKNAQERAVAGMMVKTLPVYCRWDDDSTVADYLQQLTTQHTKAKDYADTYSFADLCSDTGFVPSLNFSYRGSIQVENIVMRGFCTASRRLGRYSTGDTLLFMADHIGDGLTVRAEYRTDRYTEGFIDSMIDAYAMVLQGFAQEEKLSAIELCSPQMTDRLETYNTDSTDKSTGKIEGTIVDLFRSHLARTGEKLLYISDDEKLTWLQVWDTASRIAAYLHGLGVGRGDVVAVMVDRDSHMLTTTIGVLCSGAAYQPLDASYPAQRLNYMMRDAAVRVLIADRNIDIEIEEDLKQQISILYTDEIAAMPTGEISGISPQREDSFILLYTSGTTGVPKGVRLTHANLMALYGVNRRTIPYVTTPDDRWAVYASYGFDAGFYTLLMPVCFGGSVTVVPEDLRYDIEGLNAYNKRIGVTFTLMTTQVGRIFATSVGRTSLKALMVGGEKLVPCAPPKDFVLLNAYGPTEGTVYSHSKIVDRLYTRVPIGLHNDDYKNYIVDKHGRRMPLGALGELLIAGPQVGAGYLNLPDKTAAVFCKNSFSDDPAYADLYHTGDIVRLLPANGEADIIGRNDGQVKIRGFRIELTEVEQVVREFRGITDATVQAFDDPAGGKFIAAYIVAKKPVDVQSLNAFIAERKPPYMVPAATVQIEKIPLTQNQKVNKRALPVPEVSEQVVEEDGRKPNMLEKIICGIVADVLNQENIPLSVSLSRLGLTSISSIRLASALYKRFGVSFKGSELVKEGSVIWIEDKVLVNILAVDKPECKSAEVKKLDTAAPLTVSQQGVYADTMRNPGTTSYNIPICFRFAAETDAETLAAALRRILDAHPYLRDAHLAIGEEDVEQTVLPAMVQNVGCRSMSADEFEKFKEDYIQPFDLMKAPLYRMDVVSTPEAVFLLMDVHHLVFDGSSLTVMLSQLKMLLEGSEIVNEEYSYLDYVESERQWLEGEGGAKAASFFKTMLADCEAASDIPSDCPHSDEPGERGITSIAVDIERVERFCRDNDLTPAALFLAATCYATARFSTSRSAFISTISTGRGDVRFFDTFGMFVKTLPVAMSIGDGSALDFALTAKSTLAGVVENEMYPYARICAEYNYAPNIVYEYQYGLVDDILIDGKPVERQLFDVDTLKFKIAVHIEEVDGKPSVAVHYRKGIYTDALMQTYCRSIAIVAQRIMDAPDAPIRKLSMLTPEQTEKLRAFAVTELTEHIDKCLHHLMERQAILHPDRKAIIASDRTLTYAELDSIANIVANNLIARGVRRGDKVVLLLSRTSRFFTSLYGVLKAGAAYIPSSPDYPEERKQSIIRDSDAAFVISDENVEELHQGKNRANPNVEVSPEDVAYLIYTSGSTGKPKGVLLRHRGIVNYVTPAPSVIHTHAIVERVTTVGSITTVAFDMALKEWGIALSNGLTLVFADDEQSNDPVALAELFGANGVDYFNTTPSRMQQYMELDEFCNMLSNCKVVICGAERYPDNLMQRLREVAPGAEIFNTYGPTEITVSSNAACLTNKGSVSVGRPLRNYIEHIVDADDNLLPPGVIGELLIGGGNIAKGYNDNPEQTAKAFIEFMGNRTYRSGDYARWDEEGSVVILGRKDTQVKLRGLRIELGEIERVMGDIKGIGARHVMIRNVAGRENLVAYYSLKPGMSLSAEEIKARMGERLTDYMVPSYFVEMQQMPLTPNGKINTRALPEPAVGEREVGRAPATDQERFFVDIYKKILGTETVYADDNFFRIGGTSLTATRIMIAASKAGHRLVYADIFANPTPEGLARLLSNTNDNNINTNNANNPANYDYTAIEKVLKGNTLDTFRAGERRELGDVVLTGATGFAGIHVLHELLTRYDCRIVCLGRDSRSGVPAHERIEQLYFYYFGESMSDLYPGRVDVVKGDITNPKSLKNLTTEKLKNSTITVINCAANVKHFSAGTDIEDINYYGVLNLIEWCKANGAALVQTSTVSVTGRQPADRDGVLTEQSLYIGQDLGGNKYIASKFMAERAVLEAHAKGEIVAKVVRLGNLAPRECDGLFQINFTTNGFMNRLKSINLVGCYPYAMYSQNKDISPIDDVARAIVLFAQTPAACVLFHGNNANRYSLGNFYYEAARAGLDIRPVETDLFADALEEAKKDPDKLNALVGLMAYEGMGEGLKPVDYSNDYSAQVLLRMGYHWPVISSQYVEKLVRQLDGLGFFSTF